MLPGLRGTGQTLVHALGEPVPSRPGLGPAIWAGVTEGNGAGNSAVICCLPRFFDPIFITFKIGRFAGRDLKNDRYAFYTFIFIYDP